MAFKKNRWDKEAQENGKWLENDGGKFLIANIPNVEFTKGFVKLQEKYGEDEKNPEFKQDLNLLLANAVLKGWEGYEEDDGSPVVYSIEECVYLLENDEPFAAWLFNEARNVENYKREVVANRTKK